MSHLGKVLDQNTTPCARKMVLLAKLLSENCSRSYVCLSVSTLTPITTVERKREIIAASRIYGSLLCGGTLNADRPTASMIPFHQLFPTMLAMI